MNGTWFAQATCATAADSMSTTCASKVVDSQSRTPALSMKDDPDTPFPPTRICGAVVRQSFWALQSARSVASATRAATSSRAGSAGNQNRVSGSPRSEATVVSRV